VAIGKIYLDMDGVLADFVAGVQGPDFLNGPLWNEQTYDHRKVEFTNKRLFRNLPYMPGALDLIAWVKDSNLPWEILTCSGLINRPLVVADKTEWIRQYVCPSVVVSSTLKGKDKKIFARPNHVLVDDKKSNIEHWEKAGGIGILHKDPKETLDILDSLHLLK